MIDVLALVSVVLVAGGCSDPGASKLAVLEKLGVDTSALQGEPTAVGGAALPGGYNPLRKSVVSLVKTDELFVAGLKDSSGNNVLALDDLESVTDMDAPDVLDPDPDAFAWPGRTLGARDRGMALDGVAKGGVAADLDGTGRDVVVMAVMTDQGLQVTSQAPGQRGRNLDPDVLTTLAVQGAFQGGEAGIDLAAGDVDGDGKEEVAIGWVNDMNKGFVWVLAKQGTTVATLFEKTYDANSVRVALGDSDDDGRAELGVTYGLTNFDSQGSASWELLRVPGGTPIQGASGRIQAPSQDGTTTRTAVVGDIAFGDVDGDGLDEVLLGGIERGGSDPRIVVLVKDDGVVRAGHQPYSTVIEKEVRRSGTTGWFGVLVEAVDVDGDPQDELLLNQILFDDLSTMVARPLASRELSELGFISANDFSEVRYRDLALTTGDLDRDHKDEVIFYDHGDNRIRVYTYDGQFRRVPQAEMTPSSSSADRRWPVLAAADLAGKDDDDLALRYTGNRTVTFTEPRIIAVLAAAPCDPGRGQDQGACATSFGTSSEVSETISQSVGVSVGATVGFEFEQTAPVEGTKIASVRWTTTIETSLDFTASQWTSRSIGVEYTTDGSEDAVVFTAIPLDVYEYEVVSDEPVEFQARTGETTTETRRGGVRHVYVSVPRTVKTYLTTLPYYNENNGDFPDIGKDVLAHTVRDVSTYRSEAQLKALGGIVLSGRTAPQGSTALTVTLNESRGTATGVTSALSISTELEVVATGFIAGVSASVRTAFGWESSVTDTTSFAGTVSGVSGAGSGFTWGLGVRKQKCKAGQSCPEDQSFHVVDYWTQL